MNDIIVKKDRLTYLVEKKLELAGIMQNHAEIIADVLVHADLRGVSSHGVLRTEHYVTRISEGGINVEPAFSVNETGPCTAIFDGDDGMGHVITKKAMEHAIKMAENNGIGMMTVKNSSHCGALSYFVQQAVQSNMIGIAMTQTDKAVVPFGGSDPFFGTNPIAFGFQAEESDPIILDMSTSNVALGKILHAKEKNRNIPDDWGVDKKGHSTTDPEKVEALLPFAGPKGYGLGMVIDILSGILSNSAYGPHIVKMYGDYKQKRKLGHFIGVLNPAYFTGNNNFMQTLDKMIHDIHRSQPAPGFDKVMVPGEPENQMEKLRRQKGIPVPVKVYEYLTENEN